MIHFNKSLFSAKDRLLTGFTLLEILIVIAIIGLLAGVVVVNSSRGMEQSRDTRRIQETYQIAHALMVYYANNKKFPDNTDNDYVRNSAQWDTGNKASQPDDFIKPLVDSGTLEFLPLEWAGARDPQGTQHTYRYSKVVNPCGCVGTYAILYTACESAICPIGERPACCTDIGWTEGSGVYDKSDIIIFLQEN